MHPAEIQCEIKKRGLTQKQIAKEIGVCAMSVSREVNGWPTSEKVRRAIANTIGRAKEEIFPGYYFNPKRRKPRSV